MNDFSAHEIKIVKTEFEKHSSGNVDSEMLKKTEKFFDRILKNNNAIKLLVDISTNKIVNCNEYAQSFYGYSEEELLQKEIYDLNVLKEDEVKAEFAKSKELGRDYFESKQKKSDGTVQKVMVRSTSLKIKDANYMYLIIHELKEDIEKEDIENKPAPIFSLESKNDGDKFFEENFSIVETQAKALVNLSNKLAESEKQLKELNASKDRFFSIISHDLKNSFFSVMGLSKILADPENDDSDDKKLETAQMLHNSSKKLYSFLENLLGWARVQRDEVVFEPEEHDLFEIIAEVFYIFKPKAKQNGVNLLNNISENTKVFCDKNMVLTILRNLVSNAINFTNVGGVVAISSITESDKVTIEVSDTGVGISEANINKLLRIDKKYIGTNVLGEKGTGLGLILCKEFVQKHNGKIWIESEMDKGSKFSFTLPFS